MRRSVVPIAALLVAVALGLVAYKVRVLGQPLVPGRADDAWAVSLDVSGTGSQAPVRLHLAIPTSDLAPFLVDERFAHPGLARTIRSRPRHRTLTLTADESTPAGRVSVAYRFGIRADPARAFPSGDPRVLPEDTAATADVPADAEELVLLARSLLGSATDGPALARIRAQYDFVLDETAADDGAPDDARRTLRTRRGPPAARCALFVALVRSLGLPARLVWSLPLVEGSRPRLDVSAEVFADDRWIPVDPVNGRFDESPRRALPLARGDLLPARFEGLSGVRLRWSVDRLSAREQARLARTAPEAPDWVEASSLDGLGPGSRPVFRVLLLVPIGALVVSVFRNMVGVSTFGTFMPILVALALLDAPPLSGLGFLVMLLLAGLATRGVLDRLRLLIVPRLSLLLTAVIAATTVLALAADRFGMHDALSVALLPVVVLTMTVERLSVTVIEEGLRNAVKMLAGTVLVAAACLLLLSSDTLQDVVFAFPELLLVVVAALLLVGRYTGYRLTELWRFRRITSPTGGAPP